MVHFSNHPQMRQAAACFLFIQMKLIFRVTVYAVTVTDMIT